jgi:hypothetical protein
MAITIVLTDSGRADLVACLLGTGAKAAYVNWGTSTTTPVHGDTALGAELGTRVAATVTAQTSNVANDTLRAVATITATGSATVAEVGLFTASTGGTLLVHAGFTAVPVLTGDQITFTFNIVFT